MTRSRDTDLRTRALDVYLERRAADGYTVETRTATQAIVARRKRLFFVHRWLSAGDGQARHVVSVDEHGVVTAAPAEPVRW